MVAEWYGAGLVTESHPQLLCTNANSAAIPPGSVNEYQQKLGSKWAYHAIHWPRIHGLVASAGVWLRAMNRRSAPPHGP